MQQNEVTHLLNSILNQTVDFRGVIEIFNQRIKETEEQLNHQYWHIDEETHNLLRQKSNFYREVIYLLRDFVEVRKSLNNITERSKLLKEMEIDVPDLSYVNHVKEEVNKLKRSDFLAKIKESRNYVKEHFKSCGNCYFFRIEDVNGEYHRRRLPVEIKGKERAFEEFKSLVEECVGDEDVYKIYVGVDQVRKSLTEVWVNPNPVARMKADFQQNL